MNRSAQYSRKIDWPTVIIYLSLVIFGWLTIYSANFNEGQEFALNLSSSYGRQLFWIPVSFIAAFFILIIDVAFFTGVSYLLYIFLVLVLILVLGIGQEVHGAKSWLVLGSVKIQPAEFAKFTTALALARYINMRTFNFKKLTAKLWMGLIVFVPVILILLQNDTGSMLAYSAFLLVLYREGMTPWVLIMGVSSVSLFLIALLVPSFLNIVLFFALVVGVLYVLYLGSQKETIPRLFNQTLKALYIISLLLVLLYWGNWWSFPYLLEGAFLILGSIIVASLFQAYLLRFILKKINRRLIMPLFVSAVCISYISMVGYAFNNVLKPHQKSRIEVLIGLKLDPSGVGFHGIQSRMAIGSGGLSGKGYLNGTRTRGKFVPEQSTDFIFCTIGEEQGFIGCLLVIGLYLLFMLRLVNMAERQRSVFSRVYGYCVVSIFFVHFAINIGMVIGILPIIGIPLPFFSYGGSSLLAFTILLFIFIKLDSERLMMLH